jgi:hypothetical protein
MFAKLLTGVSLEDLEKKLGTFFSELQNAPSGKYLQTESTRTEIPAQLKIYHVHSFITQEVGKTASITVNGPAREVITKFSLMIIAGYE